MVDNYDYFNIPKSCEVKNTIFKKLFYENADLSNTDKKLFTDVISKITWLYCLKPETTNIKPYKDSIREYNEIEFIEVELIEEKSVNRIAEIIMRIIPYPMLLIFCLNNKVKLYVAHQRNNLNDSSKNTIDEYISTEWLDNKETSLFNKLDILKFRFTNFYDLYCDIVDAISIYNASEILSGFSEMSGEEARKLTVEIKSIEEEIAMLKSKINRETQFNKKIELNIEIKKLEKRKTQLIGGN